MIKYLGSKRRLVPLLAALAEIAGGSTALDLFTGTTRVAQCFRQLGRQRHRGGHGAVLRGARPYVRRVGSDATPRRGWRPTPSPSSTPCGPKPATSPRRSASSRRYFHPDNGARIDAIRAAIARDHAGSWLEPVLLTSLLEAADRVDSTTGLQMAYLKQWAPRARQRLELRLPKLPVGPPGRALRADAVEAVSGRSAASTSPTSTRPTTSTATSRTTTSGRPWWPGTTRPTTAWPASGPTLAIRPPAASSTIDGACPRRSAAAWPTWTPGS